MDNPVLQYYLSLDSKRLVASVGLNDIPILQDRVGGKLRTVRPVNQWIRPGTNSLHYFVNWPPKIPFEKGAASLKTSVFIASPAGDVPTPQSTLAELGWPLPPAPEVYPMRMAAPFKVVQAPPLRLWDEAERVNELGPADRDAIIALINNLGSALAAGRAADAYALMEYRYAEEERAFGKPAGSRRAVVMDQFAFMADHPDRQFTPLTSETSAIRLFGDNRVALIERIPAEHAVVIISGVTRFRIPGYLSRIGGQWRIVR